MMRSVRLFGSIFAVAARRLWAKKGLAVAGALGFILAVALAYTLPIYADSVYQRILNRDLNFGSSSATRIPPFWFNFRYDTWGDYPSADTFLSTWAPRIIKLPLKSTTRYFQTNSFRVFAMQSMTNTQLAQPLGWAPIVATEHFADHVSFTDGQMLDAGTMPAPKDMGQGTSEVQVVKQQPELKALVSQALAKDLGLSIGDRLVLVSKQDFRGAVKQPVYVYGIWIPRDRADPYWDSYQWDVMQKMIFISRDDFVHLAPTMKGEIVQASWYLDFAGQSMHVWDVPEFIGRIDALTKLIKDQRMSISLGYSPQEKLLAYQSRSEALTVQLYAFSMPVFVLVFAFLILVAGLMANSQRNEIAVLRSRGASALQVFGISFLEAVLLGVFAVMLAAPLALGIAEVLGQTRSFMTFTGDDWLSVALTAKVFPVGLGVAGVAIVITVLPIIGAARHTIITYKQEQARTMKKPLWQRAWFDLLLLLPAAYWTYLLQKQGTVDLPGISVSGAASGDPFGNPALFLVPALTMLALTLLFIRIVPLVLRLFAWVFSKLPGVTVVLAMRQVARSPGLYVVPMFLLMLTLALAIFTASVASTLDNFLVEQTYYDLGGEVRLQQTGESQAPADVPASGSTSTSQGGSSGLSLGNIGVQVTDSSSAPAASASSEPVADSGPMYSFLPISDYLQVPQVQAAARVGRYATTIHFGAGGDVSGHLLGIDRADFPRAAFWRDDFATQSLGALMNDLASAPEGVLIPRTVMQEHALHVGDRIQVNVFFPGATVNAQFKVVGAFDLWPSWYPHKPEEGPLFIGNIDYLFEQAQGEYPYDIWIKVNKGADPSVVAPQVRTLGQQGWSDDVRSIIEEQLGRPERQGLFGVLTIGFLAAALFTALGFSLYAVFSFRQRYIELGVLRAIGLSAGQMTALLSWELILILLCGAAGGTALGVIVTRLYIPFLQASDENRALPFNVLVNWPEIGTVYLLFIALFAVVLVGLVIFLRRMRIFQAVKLGETE